MDCSESETEYLVRISDLHLNRTFLHTNSKNLANLDKESLF